MPVVHAPVSAASGVRGPLRRSLLLLALTAALGGGFVCAPALAHPATSAARAGATLDIPYERFVLPNGLTVLVHEDHKAPVVAVASGTTSAPRTSRRARPVSRTCSST